MQLPPQLGQAIAQETAPHSLHALTQAASELSEHYRSQGVTHGRCSATAAHRLAYVAMRMPATFAATCAVFADIRRLLPDHRITSLLDLGAGPGTAGWAALAMFDTLQQLTLVEQDAAWIRLGKSLARAGANAALEHADWVRANVRTMACLSTHDLVVSAYALGEMHHNVARETLKVAWAATRTAMAIIEPGTMRSFALMRTWRDDLIALGGHVLAPCPHQQACPMPVNDWCHFAQRVERSALHRRIKLGTLGYEDEKFSYIVVSKHPVTPAPARVIRHPQRHAGHTRLPLCTIDGLHTITVTRSATEPWQRARKIAWGDAW